MYILENGDIIVPALVVTGTVLVKTVRVISDIKYDNSPNCHVWVLQFAILMAVSFKFQLRRDENWTGM